MRESSDPLAALKARIGAIEGTKPVETMRFALGAGQLDQRLGGGLPRGRLHELFAASGDDRPALAGAGLMMAMRAGSGPLLWLRDENGVRLTGGLYAPGLAELGLDPARLIEIVAPDEAGLLRAAGDAVRCAAVSAVLIEPGRVGRGFDLTASRRLAVAAEKSGVTVLLLRGEGDPVPSAAYSRWRIASAGSVALEADAPGGPMIAIELLRHRGGLAGLRACLEWNRDEHLFREAALPGAVLPLPAGRSVGEGDPDGIGGARLSA